MSDAMHICLVCQVLALFVKLHSHRLIPCPIKYVPSFVLFIRSHIRPLTMGILECIYNENNEMRLTLKLYNAF